MRSRKWVCLTGIMLMIMTVGCTEKAEVNTPAATGSITAQENTPTASDTVTPEETKEEAGWKHISQDEAKRIMAEEAGFIILDVRSRQEYDEGHIPGAVCIPNETIGEKEIPELPDKDQTILVYCRSGRRSKEASEKLAALGYTGVLEFGGILDWTGEIVTEEGSSNGVLQLTLSGREIPVVWEENASVDALKALAYENRLSVTLSPYGGFEQVGPLGEEIEREDTEITSSPGDIMLYAGDQIVLFYGSNTWAYTKLGHIDLAEDELEKLLGGEQVDLTLTIVNERE